MSKTAKSNKLSKEQVLHLAKLVRLELTDEEIEALSTQLGETLDYIKNLEELDTKNIKETAHSGDAINVTFQDGDSPDRTFTQEEALKNAPKKDKGFFVVSKILNK